MKNPIQILFAFTLLAFIFACGESESEDTMTAEKAEEEHTHMDGTSHEDHEAEKMHSTKLEKGTLKMNNGKPWEANLETTMGIRNMKQHMAEYDSIDHINDCNELYENLHKEMNYIIRECTMEGEPHNQLHHYLYTIQKNFDGLKSNKLDSCRHSYAHINEQLAEYSKYFTNKEK